MAVACDWNAALQQARKRAIAIVVLEAESESIELGVAECEVEVETSDERADWVVDDILKSKKVAVKREDDNRIGPTRVDMNSAERGACEKRR